MSGGYLDPVLPTIEGIIARRVLLNVRVDPEVAARIVPAPLEVDVRSDSAVAGVCLIRLEGLRPKGSPTAVGISSENMAHRIAIRYPSRDGMKRGVFIWRRETDNGLMKLLGGRLFPGVHGKATFDVSEGSGYLEYRVRSSSDVDLSLGLHTETEWRGCQLFPELRDIETFFADGDYGYSCTLRGDRLEGLRLRSLAWKMNPLMVSHMSWHSSVTQACSLPVPWSWTTRC